MLTSTIVGGELSLAPGVALSLTMGRATRRDRRRLLRRRRRLRRHLPRVDQPRRQSGSCRCSSSARTTSGRPTCARRETMLGRSGVSALGGGRYGMPRPRDACDGNDVEAVHAAAREAAAYVRENRKPYFLETYTYRHARPLRARRQAYVTKDELAALEAARPDRARERERLLDATADRARANSRHMQRARARDHRRRRCSSPRLARPMPVVRRAHHRRLRVKERTMP